MKVDSPGAAAVLAGQRDELFARARTGSVRGFPARLAHAVDTYFTTRLGELAHEPLFAKGGFALVAVGGYGRSELCPYSDLDILLLFPKRIPKTAEETCSKLLHPLWDLGFDLGHGVRTVADCVRLAQEDYQVLTSLLDARPLCGDANVFPRFQEAFAIKVLKKRGAGLAPWLAKVNEEREAEFGDAGALLQPDLKNGLGGLRDAHQVLWLTRVMEETGLGTSPFLPEEMAGLRRDADILLGTRTALHLAAGRRTDKLHFDLQPRVAEMLGFAASDQTALERGRNVEFFLSRLSAACTRIKAMRQGLFIEAAALSGRKTARPEHLGENVLAGPAGLSLASQPKAKADHVLALFQASAETGRPLTWGTFRFVRDRVVRWGAQLADRPVFLNALMSMAMAPHGGPALEAMASTGLIGAALPEFGWVEDLVQFDDYHVHPVGEHTLKTIVLLGSFIQGQGDWAGELAQKVDHPERLLMAALFHDLAKEAPGHASAGAVMAGKVLARFQVPEATASEVAFLVRHHLLIPKTATRRDMNDEAVLVRVAETCETVERLTELYLLSVADSMATGPRAWNDWTRALFAECYFKARNLLERGPLSGPDAAPRMAETRDRVRSRCRRLGLDSKVVEQSLERMPSRALEVLDPDALAVQVSLADEFRVSLARDRERKPGGSVGKGICRVRAKQSRAEGCTEVTVAAMDRKGLFAALAGVFVLQGLEVLSAEVFTWKDGLAMDVFTVKDPPENTDEYWSRTASTMSGALTGGVDLEYRVNERKKSPLASVRSPKLPVDVRVDNEASDFFTVAEVAAPDRTALLYDLAKAISLLDMDIRLARIATFGGKVADVFFLRGPDGGKVTDPALLDTLRTELAEAAEG